jgi:hypothetical protein
MYLYRQSQSTRWRIGAYKDIKMPTEKTIRYPDKNCCKTMNIPKQSMPVMRILPSVSYSSQFGVSPSQRGIKFINQLFGLAGNCSCRPRFIDRDGVTIEPDPNGSQCNNGFAPRCLPNGKCRCEKDGDVLNFGRAVREFNTMQEMMMAFDTSE